MVKFLIIGNGNAVIYKEVFPLIKDNKMWLGYLPMGSETFFHLTEEYKKEVVATKKEGSAWVNINGEIMGRVTQVVWFTNIETKKRHTPLDLYKKYSNEDYPKYDNYDAIECSKVCEIPMDYDGVIGVPISFLNKYCHEQFEIVGLTSSSKENTYGMLKGNVTTRAMINDKKVYARILIRIHDPEEWNITELEGNGDFRSAECIELLKQSDVVVSNPPFSLFREYVAQLIEYGKKFLIIGNINAVTYKELFPLIKDNKMWWGFECVRWFIMPNDTDKETKYNNNGENVAEGARSRWYTNIEHSKRHTPLDLYKKYSNEDYPKYDNYDAIECNKSCNIPMDYDGVIGVPITFLEKYCHEQFEILGLNGNDGRAFYVNGKGVYARILIRRKK